MDIGDHDEQREEMNSQDSNKKEEADEVACPEGGGSLQSNELTTDEQALLAEGKGKPQEDDENEEELLRAKEDEDIAMDCDDAQEKELLNIEGTFADSEMEERKSDGEMESKDSNDDVLVEKQGNSGSMLESESNSNSQPEISDKQKHDAEEEKDEAEGYSAENADCDVKVDGEVDCAKEVDAPTAKDDSDADDNSISANDKKTECEKKDDVSSNEVESVEQKEKMSSNVVPSEVETVVDPKLDTLADEETVTPDGNEEPNEILSASTTQDNSIQICSIESINSPVKILKITNKGDSKKESNSKADDKTKSYNDSSQIEQKSENCVTAYSISKSDGEVSMEVEEEKSQDGKREGETDEGNMAGNVDKDKSDDVSSAKKDSHEETLVSESESSAITDNCDEASTAILKEDTNASKTNSQNSASNNLSQNDKSAQDSQIEEKINEIKSEPNTDSSVNSSEVNTNTEKSSSQQQTEMIQADEESSLPRSEVGDKNVTNNSNSVTKDSNKSSAIPDSSSEVKIKEEALSPGHQNETGDDKVDKNKKDANAKDQGSNTQSSETDSSDAQKKTTVSTRTCAECGVGKSLKYQVLFQGKTRFLCGDVCFKAFRGKQKLAPPPPSQGTKSAVTCGICNREIKNGQGFFPFSGDSKPVCSEECMVKYQQAHTPKPSCAQCKAPIEGRTKCLIWETMEFCNEDCLGSYQATMGSHCACCKAPVQRLSLGKYCVRFGADIRQFCTGKCLEEFKKGLKVCTFCQKDMSNTSEGFLAPIGDKFRDFCTSECMERYEVLNATTSKRPSVHKCSVCQKIAAVKVQVHHKDKDHVLCSDPCIAAFRYTQKIYASLCDLCHKLFNNQPLCLQIDNTAKKFCTKTCLNLFVLAHRKIVPCTWCKVKKYNFDMIERVDLSNNVQQFCSLNCLSLFRVSLNATSSKCIKCDHCHMNLPAQYHLTMSDASIRNFCSYPCVIKFQGQFTSVPTLTTVTPSLNRQGPTPVGKETRVPPATPVTPVNDSSSNNTPVIANVMSLAGTGPPPATAAPAPKTVQATGTVTNAVASAATATTNGLSVMREVHREVIVAPPVPRMLKNKMIMCKPLVQNKGVACKPHPCHKETQTDSTWGTPVIVPVPVPIFVPAPVHMFSRSVPFPMPFPVPIPVPIFIPTTRKTTAKVIKDIFEIQEKVPSNPYEAELLLMAEMVAADEDKTENENEEDDEEKKDVKDDPVTEDKKEEEKADSASTVEKLESLEDLEVAVPAPVVENCLPVVKLTPLAPECILNENVSEESLPAEETAKPLTPTNSVARRGTKRTRGGRGRGGRGRKRQKIAMDSDTSDEEWLPSIENVSDVIPVVATTTPKTVTKSSTAQAKASASPVLSVSPIVIAVTSTAKPELKIQSPPEGGSPDANLCLKYMFGVNAWKHWVVQKNVQLEKGGSQSRRLKLFKTDLLQLSPDELNYSLCLFVKEVRKPNGEEYAPDSIYYLCLGVQMYLYENGRVDNIFTDPYYEKFTECLNDVLQKHEVLGTLRKEAYFVSRIEEEILWESKQLGAHSPQVLLNTLMYFNTKMFNLQNVDDHLQLSFTYIMKGWRKLYNQGSANKSARCAVLRYYPPPARGYTDAKKGFREDSFTYEQEENVDNPLRCPVKLYEFYLSKCPESVRQRNDLFYMCPERSCVPDSPVWYSAQALPKESLLKMLQRVSLVREISTTIPSPVSVESRANSD